MKIRLDHNNINIKGAKQHSNAYHLFSKRQEAEIEKRLMKAMLMQMLMDLVAIVLFSRKSTAISNEQSLEMATKTLLFQCQFGHEKLKDGTRSKGIDALLDKLFLNELVGAESAYLMFK